MTETQARTKARRSVLDLAHVGAKIKRGAFVIPDSDSDGEGAYVEVSFPNTHQTLLIWVSAD